MAFAISDMQLKTAAFDHHGQIPTKYTGEGSDVSPPLEWSAAPSQAKSFAIICHDPDAPLVQNGAYGFVHWLLYNLPSSVTSLAEATTEGTNGTTDFGKSNYGGPMPPEGHGTHHYFFWVLALDKELNLPAGLTLGQLLEKVEPHLIGMNRLIGTYQR